MTQQQIEQNKLIAAFCNMTRKIRRQAGGRKIYYWTCDGENKLFPGMSYRDENPPNFEFHWEMLMHVVVKIETIENSRFGFTIDPWGIVVIDYKENEKEVCHFQNDDNYPKIQQYYETVLAFIKFYNSLTRPTEVLKEK